MTNETTTYPDRRLSCELHKENETRIDKLDSDINKQSGWIKAAAGFTGFSLVILATMVNFAIGKLSTIEGLLMQGQVSMAQHSEQIKAVKTDVDEMKDRHRFKDQQNQLRGR